MLVTIAVAVAGILALLAIVAGVFTLKYAKQASDDIARTADKFAHMSHKVEKLMAPAEEHMDSILAGIDVLPETLKNLGGLADSVAQNGLADLFSEGVDKSGGKGMLQSLADAALKGTQSIFGAASEIDGQTMREVKHLVHNADAMVTDAQKSNLVELARETISIVHDTLEPILRAVALLNSVHPYAASSVNNAEPAHKPAPGESNVTH